MFKTRPGHRVDERLVEDRHEARHGNEADVVALQGIHHLVGVPEPIEARAEGGALDEHGRHSGVGCHLERPARTVGNRHDDGDVGREDRFEDRAAARRKHPDPRPAVHHKQPTAVTYHDPSLGERPGVR